MVESGSRVAWQIGITIALSLSASAISRADDSLCTPLTAKQIKKNDRYQAEAARYAIYAILSTNAYARGAAAIPLPPSWVEVPDLRKEFPKIGLALATFEKREGSQLTEVVVAFRGTDERLDWIQNLVPFDRIQVPVADTEFDAIHQRYTAGAPKIVVTGHSLGGGLALHMSLRHEGVDAVVFDSSPVTKAGKRPITTNTRVSIWESGEALQLARNVVNAGRIRWKGTQRIEFRFLHASGFTQHGIESLALNLTKLGGRTSTDLSDLIATRCGAGINR